MRFYRNETVIWNGIKCVIHHFSEYGVGETVAWLDGVPDAERTLYGGWQMARLPELTKYGCAGKEKNGYI